MDYRQAVQQSHWKQVAQILLKVEGRSPPIPGLRAPYSDLWRDLGAAQTVPDYSNLLQMFVKHFSQQPTNEEAPVMNALVQRLYRTGVRAGEGEEVCRVLSKLVTSLINGATEGRREAALPMVTRLFRLWLSLGKVRLAHNLAKALDSQELALTRGDVAYAYYRGRMALMAGQSQEATRWLEQAASLGPLKLAQYRAIHAALIPLRMIKGWLPSKTMLHELPFWNPFIDAFRRGDYLQFEGLLAEHRAFLVRHQVFMLCHTLLLPRVLRNLIKSAAVVMGEEMTRLPFSHVEAALRLRSIPWPPHQIEFELARLIHAGLIRGYLSHDKATLVLSRKNAFPRLDQ